MKKTNDVELLDSPITSSTFENLVCIPYICKLVDYKIYVDNVFVSSHVLLATNDVISPNFEKYTTCIGS